MRSTRGPAEYGQFAKRQCKPHAKCHPVPAEYLPYLPFFARTAPRARWRKRVGVTLFGTWRKIAAPNAGCPLFRHLCLGNPKEESREGSLGLLPTTWDQSEQIDLEKPGRSPQRMPRNLDSGVKIGFATFSESGTLFRKNRFWVLGVIGQDVFRKITSIAPTDAPKS